MALSRADKEALVAEVSEMASQAQSAVAAEYRGLSVGEMTELRAQARNAGVYMKVVKNSLAKLAVAGTDFECMRESLKGPLLLAFSQEDPGAAARVVKAFAKEHEKLVTVSVSIGGDLFPADNLDQLASLPTLDEARAKLLGTLEAPLSQLVRTLAEPHGMLVRTLGAYSSESA